MGLFSWVAIGFSRAKAAGSVLAAPQIAAASEHSRRFIRDLHMTLHVARLEMTDRTGTLPSIIGVSHTRHADDDRWFLRSAFTFLSPFSVVLSFIVFSRLVLRGRAGHFVHVLVFFSTLVLMCLLLRRGRQLTHLLSETFDLN